MSHRALLASELGEASEVSFHKPADDYAVLEKALLRWFVAQGARADLQSHTRRVAGEFEPESACAVGPGV